jgi:phosphopantothenoylcysteine decarboxylase / phosphopantothenate---cysteine ligase
VDHVVLGVSGGIAAYKSIDIVRRLRERGVRVTVVPTPAALKFIGEPTWSAISGEPVASTVWGDPHEVRHVRLGQQADLIFIAPATADLMARAVHGIADDLLGNVLLTARCPVVMAPAMHTEMWRHPATQRNVDLLRERGVRVLEPDSGRLTGSDSGPGRLPDPAVLVDLIDEYLQHRKDLQGMRVLVTAGGTREPLDPVRYLGNRSSGKQGIAVAEAAAQRGADVTLITANVDHIVPPGIEVISVGTAAHMAEAVLRLAPEFDVIVMAAAVADFRARQMEATKIKKQADTASVELELVHTQDILRALVAQRTNGQIIIGFAAETGDEKFSVREYGEHKRLDKGCDLLVINEVGEGKAFGQDVNTVTIVGPAGVVVEAGPAPKLSIAHTLWDTSIHLMKGSSS